MNTLHQVLKHTDTTQMQLQSETGISQSKISKLCRCLDNRELKCRLSVYEYELIHKAMNGNFKLM